MYFSIHVERLLWRGRMYRKAFANKLWRPKIISNAKSVCTAIVNHAFDNAISIIMALTSIMSFRNALEYSRNCSLLILRIHISQFFTHLLTITTCSFRINIVFPVQSSESSLWLILLIYIIKILLMFYSYI